MLILAALRGLCLSIYKIGHAVGLSAKETARDLSPVPFLVQTPEKD